MLIFDRFYSRSKLNILNEFYFYTLDSYNKLFRKAQNLDKEHESI